MFQQLCSIFFEKLSSKSLLWLFQVCAIYHFALRDEKTLFDTESQAAAGGQKKCLGQGS